MTASSPGRRARLAKTLAVSVASAATAVTLALAGCSAGQITQTASQVPAVPGTNADAGTIALRDVRIDYPGPEGYPQGGDAPMVVRLFNTGFATVTLTGVSAGSAAASVDLVGGTPTVVPSSAVPTTAPSAAPTGEPSPEPSGSAAPGSPTPTETAPAAPQPISVEIPAQSFVLLVPGQGAHLRLTGLAAPLRPGESVTVTFTFDDGSTTEMTVPLVSDGTVVPRGESEIEGEGH